MNLLSNHRKKQITNRHQTENTQIEANDSLSQLTTLVVMGELPYKDKFKQGTLQGETLQEVIFSG